MDVDWESVQYPVFPGYLVTKTLSPVNGITEQLVGMVKKPVVPGFDVASDPCFLITSFGRRTFLEFAPESFSDPTRMKVAIRDDQKGEWQRETVFGEPIESRLQISFVELLVLCLCHPRITFSGLFKQLMELLIGGQSAFADLWKVN